MDKGVVMREMSGFLRDEAGASAAEYALLLAILGVVIAGAALFLGRTIACVFYQWGGHACP